MVNLDKVQVSPYSDKVAPHYRAVCFCGNCHEEGEEIYIKKGTELKDIRCKESCQWC